jgi:beta-glucosidase
MTSYALQKLSRCLLALLTLLALTLTCAGCRQKAASTSAPADTFSEKAAPYQDPTLPVEARVQDLLGRMTLEEKIGQMTQGEKNSTTHRKRRPADPGRGRIGGRHRGAVRGLDTESGR